MIRFAAFLIRHLEQKSCELSFDIIDVMFVVRALQQVGETLPRLHELYDRLQANKVSGDDVMLAMVKRLCTCVHVQLELEPFALVQLFNS